MKFGTPAGLWEKLKNPNFKSLGPLVINLRGHEILPP
jgi:hypothetical protein